MESEAERRGPSLWSWQSLEYALVAIACGYATWVLLAVVPWVGRRGIQEVSGSLPVLCLWPYVDYWNGAGSWRAMPSEVRAKLCGRAAQLCAAFHANSSSLTTLADCRALACPTLIICGGETRPPARRISEILAHEIPGARRTVIAGAGHMSPLTHSAEVAAAIADHLNAPAGVTAEAT